MARPICHSKKESPVSQQDNPKRLYDNLILKKLLYKFIYFRTGE